MKELAPNGIVERVIRVDRLLDQGLTVSEACDSTGISPRELDAWLREVGLLPLEPPTQRPTSSNNHGN